MTTTFSVNNILRDDMKMCKLLGSVQPEVHFECIENLGFSRGFCLVLQFDHNYFW